MIIHLILRMIPAWLFADKLPKLWNAKLSGVWNGTQVFLEVCTRNSCSSSTKIACLTYLFLSNRLYQRITNIAPRITQMMTTDINKIYMYVNIKMIYFVHRFLHQLESTFYTQVKIFCSNWPLQYWASNCPYNTSET